MLRGVCFLLIVVLFYSCTTGEIENEETKSKTRIEYILSKNGERQSQYLISFLGDTICTVNYSQNKEVDFKGHLIFAEFILKRRKNERDSNTLMGVIHAINLDFKKKRLVIQEFVNDSSGYQLVYFEEFNSESISFNFDSNEDRLDLVVGVVYLDTINEKAAESSYLTPRIFDFEKNQITEKPIPGNN